jgi:hypothetical protein
MEIVVILHFDLHLPIAASPAADKQQAIRSRVYDQAIGVYSQSVMSLISGTSNSITPSDSLLDKYCTADGPVVLAATSIVKRPSTKIRRHGSNRLVCKPPLLCHIVNICYQVGQLSHRVKVIFIMILVRIKPR